MSKKNKTEDLKYGREILLDDLYSQAQSEGKSNPDIVIRLKWMNQILESDKAGKDSETISKQFKIDIEKNPHLFSFMCHLASKKQFAHTWSYLIDQKKDYVDSFPHIESFIDSMLANVQEFIDVFGKDDNFSISVNDVFSFRFDKDAKAFHGKVKWEKCFELIDIRKKYYVKLYFDTIPLFVMQCELGEKITDILKEWKEIGKRHKEDKKDKNGNKQ